MTRLVVLVLRVALVVAGYRHLVRNLAVPIAVVLLVVACSGSSGSSAVTTAFVEEAIVAEFDPSVLEVAEVTCSPQEDGSMFFCEARDKGTERVLQTIEVVCDPEETRGEQCIPVSRP